MGLGLAMLQNSARTAGQVDPVTRTVRQVLSPASQAAAGGVISVNRTFESWRQGPKLLAENQLLKAQAASLQLYGADAVLLRGELEQLHKLSQIPVPANRSLAYADVIGFWPVENRLSINLGSKHGIKPDMPVIAPEGLAGVIETVEKETSQVLLLSSPSVKIGAMVARPSPSYGITSGLKFDALTMEVPGSAPVEVDDRVQTSGLSDVIPGGIVIGLVTDVAAQAGYGTRQLTIFPLYRISPGQRLVVVR